MDPILFALILALLLGGGGAAWRTLRERRRRRLREALEQARPHGSQSVSLFDVFWDLGASDVALEMMRRDGLLPTSPDELRDAHRELDALVGTYGSYRSFVNETLDAIQEFHEARLEGDVRRRIPALETRDRKLLSLDDSGETAILDAGALAPADGTEAPPKLGDYAGEPLSRRATYRESHSASDLRIRYHGDGGDLVHVDDFGDLTANDLLGSFVEGDFTETLREWWDRRRVRSLKSDLDEAFEKLYDFYVEERHRRDDFVDHLLATADRWEQEADRIAELRRRDPLEGEPTATAARLLLDLAEETARSIARNADANVRRTLEEIDRLADEGDFAMAGYLVYLNRHAFFAGRSDDWGDYTQRIDNLAHRLKNEIRELD